MDNKYKKNTNEYNKYEKELLLNYPLDDKFIYTKDDKNLIYKLRMYLIELLMQIETFNKTQTELRYSCSKYFDLYDLAPIGYCSINEEGHFIEVNHTTTDLLGVKKDSLKRSRITRFIINKDRKLYYIHINKLIGIKEPQSFELCMCKKDGTTFWAHIESNIVKDSNGFSVCNLAITNISKFKLEEEELKENEKKYKSLFESTRDSILRNADLRRRAEEKMSLDKSLKMFSRLDKNILHELCVHKIELELQNEELMRAQIALNISNEKYLKLYENAPVGYSTISKKGTFLAGNLMIKELFELNDNTMYKHSITNFITYENQDTYYLRSKYLFETHESQSYDLKMIKGDGIPFWAHIEASISKNEVDDEPICYLVIMDISKFKWTELALKEYIDQHKKNLNCS